MDRSAGSQQKDELTDVVANVQRVLKPIAPPSAFRERLRDNLQWAAGHRLTHHAPEFFSDRQSAAAWNWMLGAALMGAVIGFVAIQLSVRHRRITI